MHKPTTYFISLLAGVLVVIGLAWVMSNMILVESVELETRYSDTVFVIDFEREQQLRCEMEITDISRVVESSRICQADEECTFLRVPSRLANYLGCEVSIQQEEKSRVLEAFNQSSSCSTSLYCRMAKVRASVPVCKNNTCTWERQERPLPLDVLTQKTLESISDNLLEEDG